MNRRPKFFLVLLVAIGTFVGLKVFVGNKYRHGHCSPCHQRESCERNHHEQKADETIQEQHTATNNSIQQ